MSVAAISSSSFSDPGSQRIHNNLQQFQQQFQQLGTDLQSGTLSAARQDFATLRRLVPEGNSTPPPQTGNPVLQDFHQLGQDLRAGNAASAKQDYSNLKQGFQKVAHSRIHHHFRSHDGGQISQLFDQLGQALQSGNAPAAQASYNSLLQDLQQTRQSNDPAFAAASATNLSVSA